MSIHNQDTVALGSGFAKELSLSALTMIQDNLQIYQYQFPEKSSIRELVSNAYDSIQEKLAAYEILTGKATPDKYWIHRDDPEYVDSNWDPTYYDLKHLNMEKNLVQIYYHQNDNASDVLEVRDHGIGVGGKRLRGYFQLGYSSKRNSRLPLGKFGLGAKVPLATQVPFFTMESVYNGAKFRFNIYLHKIDSIIPRLNLSTGQENESVILNPEEEDPEKRFTVYYEKTDELNYTSVKFDTKHRNRQKYMDSIHQQLAYFPDVELIIVKNMLPEDPVKVSAKIAYEDEYIVVSDNDYYTKPHLVLNRVNYGYVNWEELELQDHFGNVGIKLNMEDVTVNPSRESVIWNETTRSAITDRIRQTFLSAERVAGEMLKGLDFIEWARRVSSTSHWGDYDKVFKSITSFVDIKGSQLSYLSKNGVKLTSRFSILKKMGLRKVMKVRRSKAWEIVTEEEVTAGDLTLPIYIMEESERSQVRKNKYLIHLHGNEGFVMIKAEPHPTPWFLSDPGTKNDLKALWGKENFEKVEKMSKEDYLELYNSYAKEFFNEVISSKDVFKYSEVVIPDGMEFTDELEEKDPEPELTPDPAKPVQAKTVIEAAEVIRRKEGRIVAVSPVMWGDIYSKPMYGSHAIDPKVKFIRNLPVEEVYIGTRSDTEDQKRMELASRISRLQRRHSSDDFYPERFDSRNSKWMQANMPEFLMDVKTNSSGIEKSDYKTWRVEGVEKNLRGPVSFLLMSKDNRKLFRNYYDISEFFGRVEDKTITMSTALVKWNTARKIKPILKKVQYLRNFSAIDPVRAKEWADLKKYVNDHFEEVSLDDVEKEELITFLDKVFALQTVVHKETDKNIVYQASRQLFDAEFDNACSVEMDLVTRAEELYEWAEPYRDLLNHIMALTGIDDGGHESEYWSKKMLPDALVTEIRSYINSKQE